MRRCTGSAGRDLPDNTTDTIPAGRFVGPACVIDVTAEVAANDDYLLDVAALERWEAAHGRIPRGAWVLLRTGWAARTGAAFLNVRDDGPHGPGFDRPPRRLLAVDRDVLGVGVETIGTDAGPGGPLRSAVSRITTSCTATASSGWRASATSIDCRRPAPS